MRVCSDSDFNTATLNIAAPTHLTEALRTNMTGGKTVAQLLAEAAAKVPFMSLTELKGRIGKAGAPLIVLEKSTLPSVAAWLATHLTP